MNRLFVCNKPANMVSNHFLSRIKRKYGVKKAGFSGTLDPFANGVLIVAFGQYTKLFRFLKKAPKRYRATLWMGAESPTLDIEKVQSVTCMMPFHIDAVNLVLKNLVGSVSYLPPKYSAKKVDGQRAYALARNDKEFSLHSVTSEVYECSLVSYMHPFITFEISISEGGYVRSIGEIIATKLGFFGSLSALERLNEGDFVFDDEKELNPLEYLNLPNNRYLGDKEDVLLGRKLQRASFKNQENGCYALFIDGMLGVVEICEDEVVYHLNLIKVEKC